MIRILLVDDHALIRSGLRKMLEDDGHFEVVGEASSGEEALTAVAEHRPNVVLMDVGMPGMGGLEATRKIIQTYDGVRVVVVTMHDSEPFPSKLLDAGASGYLTKDSPFTEILQAIRDVHRGKRYLAGQVAQKMALSSMGGADQINPFGSLSRRELQVLLLVTQGMTVKEISEKLCLSPKTVSTYRHRLFEKLDVDNDVELTRLAMRHGVSEDNIAQA